MSEKLLLKWNNHMNVMGEFKQFLLSGTMIDVTLACDGQSLKAHKLVLSACSSFFKTLFIENPCNHPIVILKDMKYTELKAILDFMYCGEVSVEVNQVCSLVKTAQTLKVNGLGEVEFEDDYFNSESENQSDDESINESVCTLDVHNTSFTEDDQPMIDPNDNRDSASEIVIMETLEIKEEEMSSEYKNHSVPCLSDLSMSFQSFETHSPESKKDMPNLKRQTLTTDSLPKQSIQSPVESKMQLHQNHLDNMPSLISISSMHASPQNHTDNMPNLISTTPTGVSHVSSQSLQSSAQSEIKLDKNLTHYTSSSLSVTTTHQSQKQLFQPPVLPNVELINESFSHNKPGLFSGKSILISQGQSFQSSPLSDMELNEIDSHNMPCSNSVVAIPASQGLSFPSAPQSKIELNEINSQNVPCSKSVVSAHESKGQSHKSPALSNTEMHQNHANNMPGSLSVTSTCVLRGQSAQSNKQLHGNPVTCTCISRGQLFQSSTQSSMKLHQNHSDNMPRSVSITSTHMPSNATAIDRKQSSSSSDSGTKLKRKMKLRELPSRMSVYAMQKQMEIKEVYQPPILQKPKVLIIDDSNAIKDHDNIKDSKSSKKEGKLYECKICPFKTISKHSLSTHVKTGHPEARTFKCSQCAFVTVNKYNFEHHNAVHQRERPYPCSLCTYKFRRCSDLNKHVKKIHKLDRLIFKCQKCAFSAAEQESIEKHMIEIHEKIPTIVINKLPEVIVRSAYVINKLPEVINESLEVVNKSPEVVNMSPEVVNMSPEVVNKLPEVNKSLEVIETLTEER